MRHAGRYGGYAISACRQPESSAPASSIAVTGGTAGACSASAASSGPAIKSQIVPRCVHTKAPPATMTASARKRPTFGRPSIESGAAARRMAGSSASDAGSISLTSELPAPASFTSPGVAWSAQPTEELSGAVELTGTEELSGTVELTASEEPPGPGELFDSPRARSKAANADSRSANTSSPSARKAPVPGLHQSKAPVVRLHQRHPGGEPRCAPAATPRGSGSPSGSPRPPRSRSARPSERARAA